MGIKMAVAFANIFMAKIEREIPRQSCQKPLVWKVIYQTRERVFHQDIQTPRSGLKKRGAAEFF